MVLAWWVTSSTGSTGAPPSGPPGSPLPARMVRSSPRRLPRQVDGVAPPPAHLLGEVRAAGPGARDRHDRGVGQVHGAGEARGRGEQAGVAGGVGHGAPAAHRQARHGAPGAVRPGPVAAVDERDQLPHVVALPRGRPAGAVVVPVGVAPARPRVGHDHDQAEPGGGALDVALSRPRRVVVDRAVQQVEHGVAPLRPGVALGQQHPHAGGARPRWGCAAGARSGGRRSGAGSPPAAAPPRPGRPRPGAPPWRPGSASAAPGHRSALHPGTPRRRSARRPVTSPAICARRHPAHASTRSVNARVWARIRAKSMPSRPEPPSYSGSGAAIGDTVGSSRSL